MTGNLFDNAKFGDMFLTTENKQAVFLRFAENAEYKFAILYVEDWGHVQVFRHNGKEVFNDAAHSIISKQEEPVSEELEYASEKYACKFSSSKYGHDKVKDAFIAGADWQKEQFEKNRLKHCDALTEEQAQIESDFVTRHLKENDRTPTFIDAIEYGMRLQKEKITKDVGDDLPIWRKKNDFEYPTQFCGVLITGGDTTTLPVFVADGYEIPIKDLLEKLPKED